MAFIPKLLFLALIGTANLKVFALPNKLEILSKPSQDEIELPPSVPAKIKLTDQPSDPAGKLVKLRYGPFTIPPNSVFSVLPEEFGGVKIAKPCDECYMTAFQGGLEYEDGSEANVNTGMYLHHFVLTNKNKPDWLCGMRLGGAFRPAYVYNSGNERPPVRLNSKHKFGMRVDKPDTFGTAAELMNMSNETKTVYSSLIYEVVPLDTPGYREATHLRIDVWQCGPSDVPAKSGAYTYTSPKYKSQYSGVILHTDGHGHDGTTDVDLFINGKLFCKSIQYYGLRKSATQPKHIAMKHGDSSSVAMQYISDAVACEDNGRVEKGDEIWTAAHYNGTKYPQMVFKGHTEPQMGIHFLYIGRDEATLNDKLLFEPKFDELPQEMNKTSAMMGMPGPMSFRPPPGSPGFNASAPLTWESLLAAWGKPRDVNLTTMFPAIPPTFNISYPYVEKPFDPYKRPPPDMSRFFPGVPGIPKGPLNISDPVHFEMMEKAVKTFGAAVLPKDFKLSSVFTSGGVVTSELDELSEKLSVVYGAARPKGPSEMVAGGGEGHGHVRTVVAKAKQLTSMQEMEPYLEEAFSRLSKSSRK